LKILKNKIGVIGIIGEIFFFVTGKIFGWWKIFFIKIRSLNNLELLLREILKILLSLIGLLFSIRIIWELLIRGFLKRNLLLLLMMLMLI
jgi:hypothetical protein